MRNFCYLSDTFVTMCCHKSMVSPVMKMLRGKEQRPLAGGPVFRRPSLDEISIGVTLLVI